MRPGSSGSRIRGSRSLREGARGGFAQSHHPTLTEIFVTIHPAQPILVRLRPDRACALAPVARSLLAEFGPGGEVRLSPDGVVLAGAVIHTGACVAVAALIEGFAAQLDRTRGQVERAMLRIDPEPQVLRGVASFVLSGLICEGRASAGDQSGELVERFVCNALHHASRHVLRREPVLGRFEADGCRYLAFVAQVDDGAFLRRLDDAGGFLAEFRAAAHRAFFGLWANPFGAPWPGVGAEQESSTVLATLPLLDGVADDVRAYRAHLEGMLGPAVRLGFGALNQGYSEAFPDQQSSLRTLCPDFGPEGEQLDLRLLCPDERHYDCTRGALLAQLVQSGLRRLAESGATDGSHLCVDTWPVADTSGIERYVVPLGDEEILWTFVAFVDEDSAEQHRDFDAADAVTGTRRCIEAALSGIPRARWWLPEWSRLQDVARVSVATDVRTGRRFYFACAVLDSAEVCRRWSEPELLRQSIEDQIDYEASDYLLH